MCGCTEAPSPWRFAQARSRACTVPGAMRLPRAPTNSARSCGAASSARALSQSRSASRARAAHRHRARLAALAGHRDFALLEVEPPVAASSATSSARRRPEE